MSNIEPTEEQKQAVMAIAETEGARVQKWRLEDLARLLAEREAELRRDLTQQCDPTVDMCGGCSACVHWLREREAKLRKEYQSRAEGFVDLVLERQMLQEDLVEVTAERDTLQAEVARLEAKLNRPQPLGMVLLDENEALRARVAELEAREKFRDLAAEVDTGEPVDVLLMRTLSARVAELEADVSAAAGELLVEIPEPGSVVARLLLANTAMRRQRDALAGDRVRDAAAMDARMQAREAQHLTDIKALETRLARAVAIIVGEELDRDFGEPPTPRILAVRALLTECGYQPERCSRGAVIGYGGATAHYGDAKADAPAVVVTGIPATARARAPVYSFVDTPDECPKCQEGTHPFYDVEQARWLCDRCHHPAGEPFVHADTEGGGA